MKVKTLLEKLQNLNSDDDINIIYKKSLGSGVPSIIVPLKIVSINKNTITAKEDKDFLNKVENGNIIKLINEFRQLNWWQRYEIYLNSPAWKSKREQVLKRDNYLCQACLKNKASEVHHLDYSQAGNEPLFSLTSVCEDCHQVITMQTKHNRSKRYEDKVIFGCLADWLSQKLDISYDELLELDFLKNSVSGKSIKKLSEFIGRSNKNV